MKAPSIASNVTSGASGWSETMTDARRTGSAATFQGMTMVVSGKPCRITWIVKVASPASSLVRPASKATVDPPPAKLFPDGLLLAVVESV
jgi:hypothetical protein